MPFCSVKIVELKTFFSSQKRGMVAHFPAYRTLCSEIRLGKYLLGSTSGGDTREGHVGAMLMT